LLSIAFIGVLLGGIYVGLRSHRAAGAVAPPAAEAASEPSSFEGEPAPPARQRFLGVILAGEAVELSSRVDARVDSILVRPGDRVSRGAAVAQLDVRALRHELAVAEAAMREAQQRFARRANLSRAVISREELVEAKTQIVEKTARVKQLRESIQDARLIAPFDGVVATRYFEPGSVAPAGRPIVRLIGNEATRIRFAVPEQQATQVSVGMRLRVELETLNGPLSGVVENVAPEVETASRMIFVIGRVAVPERLKQRISSGLEAHVSAADFADGELVVEAREGLPGGRH
jgi:RND family efflux transporter MFP subunit